MLGLASRSQAERREGSEGGGGGSMKRLSGFRFDAKAKLAHFEVILPHTGGKERRRKSEAAKDTFDATTKYHAFRRLVLAHFGKLPLRRISAAGVKDFVAKMETEGYHATTINNAFAVLRKYLRD